MPTLHDYQRVAVDHLRRNDRACLFLDMGLGKTATALSALTPEHLPALVIAPKRVAETVWEAEARTWRPDLRVKVAHTSTPKRRSEALDSPADIYVLGRDNISDLLARELPYRTIILDELSGFKNQKIVRWKTMNKVIQRAQLRAVWGLTGTPTPNGLLDLWAQLALVDGGARLGTSFPAYRSRFFYPGRQLSFGVVTEWILRPGAEDQIHRLLEDICLSMSTDGRIKLPEVTFNEVSVPLPSEARNTYRKMKADLVADLTLIGGEIHSASSAAVLTNKLSQISAGFLFVDDADLRDGAYTLLHREKLRAVQEVVEGTGSPVLVFYRYRPELELLRETFGELASTVDEPDAVERWNAREIPVLLAHPASAGHGLNLQHGGHTVVWTSLPWSLEEWQQANKRVARQGQKHPVVIHLLIAPRTVDSAIRARLLDKASVQDALLNHLESVL